jgi:hypothetical protein
VALIKLSPYSDVATTWSWGEYRVPQTIHTAKSLLLSTLSKLNRDPRNKSSVSVPVTENDVLKFRKWDYFPHFDPKKLANGWYGKLDALQGRRKTYYVSGLNGFETVEFAIRAAHSVVDTYY